MFGQFLASLVPIARAEEAQEAPAPPPPAPKKVQKPTLESLSAEELEQLKKEVIDEAIAKLGLEGEALEEFFEPELVTAPFDPRFPNRNQARHCFVRFNEFYKCAHERGEDHPRCVFYQRAYMSMCPSEWIENWTDLREQGLWTGKY